MRRFLMAGVLACVVSSTAFAGIIHSTDIAPPEPPEAARHIPSSDLAESTLTPNVTTILLLIINAVV